MFIVVAIVIFGIFVSLSYTLFGSEGLTNDLKGLFETATEKVNDKKETWEPVDFKLKVLKQDNMELINFTDNRVEFKSSGLNINGDGVHIPVDYLEQDKRYKLTFDVDKVEGSIFNIGGHIHISENIETYIDGDLQKVTYLYGIKYKDDFEKHTYEVYFDTNWLESINGRLYGVNPTKPDYLYTPEVFITTNRTQVSDERKSHTVIFDNITLEKLK